MGMTSTSPRKIFNTWDTDGLPISSRHIGRTGKSIALVSGTVVLDTTAYSALDRAGSGTGTYGMIDFANAARVAGGGGVVHGATLVDLGKQNPNFDMILFHTVAGTEHGLDNAAYLLADADANKVLGTLSAGTKSAAINPTPDWITLGDNSIQHIPCYMPFDCPTGARSLYGEIICQGAWDAVAAGDLKVTLLIEQN